MRQGRELDAPLKLRFHDFLALLATSCIRLNANLAGFAVLQKSRDRAVLDREHHLDIERGSRLRWLLTPKYGGGQNLIECTLRKKKTLMAKPPTATLCSTNHDATALRR